MTLEKRLRYFGFILLTCCSLPGFSQIDKPGLPNLDSLRVPQYDAFCIIMGGDSIRLQNGRKVTAFVKETYPSGKIKHKGYYENGVLTSTFTNYYENGNIERTFRAKTDRKGTLEVFYPDGTLLSQVDWNNGQSSNWTDYYPSGQIQFTEAFDKGLEYYLYMRFYFEDGKPQVLFELTDEKSRIYNYTEFYANGKVKETGQKMHNANLGDYSMEGKWQYYNESGKLILEEDYTKGQLINDKKYE